MEIKLYANWSWFLVSSTYLIRTTDKRTDVWSQPSCIYTQIFSAKKTGFSHIKNTIFFTFVYLYFMQLFSFFKKFLNWYFVHKNYKKWVSKVAHNRSRPFYFTVQPRPQPTAQNWIFILWNLRTRHLFSYLW